MSQLFAVTWLPSCPLSWDGRRVGAVGGALNVRALIPASWCVRSCEVWQLLVWIARECHGYKEADRPRDRVGRPDRVEAAAMPSARESRGGAAQDVSAIRLALRRFSHRPPQRDGSSRGSAPRRSPAASAPAMAETPLAEQARCRGRNLLALGRVILLADRLPARAKRRPISTSSPSIARLAPLGLRRKGCARDRATRQASRRCSS